MLALLAVTVLLSVQQAELVVGHESITISKGSDHMDHTAVGRDIAAKLNSGLSPAELADLVMPLPPPDDGQPSSCEDGPIQKLYTVSNDFYWPPIYRGSCYSLSCANHTCIVERRVWRTSWVMVFKQTHSVWVEKGYHLLWYIDHTQCGCGPVTCKPPRVVEEGSCVCSKTILCPPGEIFNSTTCQCDCPPGSKKNSDGKCVQRCLQWGKKPPHHCVTGPHKHKCRCPRCEDQAEERSCVTTYCGHDSSLQCKWGDKKCSCPH